MPTIRDATARDAETILAFIQALADYEKEPDAVEVDAPTLERQLEHRPPPFECVIAEVDGEPVGFALFFHSYSTWRGRRGIWLEDLFVLPHARRRGVGRALLSHVAAVAQARDCARLEWPVLKWNQPALAFYERLGAQRLDEWVTCRISDARLADLVGPKP